MTRSARAYQAICLLAAVAILLGIAAPLQHQLTARRAALLDGPDAGAEAAASPAAGQTQDLDSFSMSLLLGGFRGPLVMYLWVTSEDQKANEQTERFLTQAQLIADLQPQFTSVYTHQAWNLAYNVSVQYNREVEKYHWVMKGVELCETGDRRLPHNTNILSELGHLYEDKLGESYESDYYRNRFRQDSLERKLDADHRLAESYARRWKYIDRLDGVLAQIAANRLANLTVVLPEWPPTARQLADLGLDDATSRHHWPYGVSVFAIAYDYLKQATLTGPSLFCNAMVTSSRPAIACRGWVREELNLAIAAEAKVWPIDQAGQPLPNPSADLLAKSAATLAEALFHYQEAVRVAELARANYESHLAVYPQDGDTFATHLNDVSLKAAMADAGLRRLTAMREWVAARKSGDGDKIARARRQLQAAAEAYRTNGLRQIKDYLVMEYRPGSGISNDAIYGRAPFELLADIAQRCIDQIDHMLQ